VKPQTLWEVHSRKWQQKERLYHIEMAKTKKCPITGLPNMSGTEQGRIKGLNAR
jgi:transposase-like protein